MTFMRKFMNLLNMDNWTEHDSAPYIENNTNFDIMLDDQTNSFASQVAREPIPNASASSSTHESGNETCSDTQAEAIVSQKNSDITSDTAADKPEPIKESISATVPMDPPVQQFPAAPDTSEIPHQEDVVPYESSRIIIRGLHLQFIGIAREIIQQQAINKIPLMREYNITESVLDEIVAEMRTAQIINSEYHILINSEELEKFIDIYEPNLFLCAHTVFDKDIFCCLGEIIFENGVEETYDTMAPDEVMDYLNIMEALNIIKYDPTANQYHILITKNEFTRICSSIPECFSSKTFDVANSKYDNADYDSMSGIEFEKFVAHILHKNGFKDIKTTPPSSDHGVDILANKDDVSYAIQCKCYSSNIGNAAVQQVHTGKALYHKDIAVVITNRYFTQQAQNEANELGVKLWNRDKLNEMTHTTQ